MKKIIAAFDGIRFSESTMQYAIYLAKESKAHLVGVFLRESTALGFAFYEMVARGSISGNKLFDDIENSDKDSVRQSVGKFIDACREANISYSVHQDKKNAVDELIHETLFADLLVIDAWETFSYLENKLPGWFIKHVLHEAHCPVMVVPRKFRPIEKMIYLYDGSPASVHATKMANYILPEFAKMKTEMLSAVNKHTAPVLPDNKLVKEWVNRHASGTRFTIIKGGEAGLMARLTKESSQSLIVAGSYQRSRLSMWFHESLANLLMRKIKSPVFIAHL
jgi:hypothetical protein